MAGTGPHPLAIYWPFTRHFESRRRVAWGYLPTCGAS
jgi:hypothetical protein